MLRRVWTSLALLVLCAQATPLAVTLDDRVVADAVVAALVAHGLDVVATDDARAPVVLAGHTRRTPVRSELLGPKLHRLDLTASLRLVRRLDGRVLATFELHGRGLGVSEVAAEQQAATEAVRALAEQVAVSVSRGRPTRRRGALRGPRQPSGSARPRGRAQGRGPPAVWTRRPTSSVGDQGQGSCSRSSLRRWWTCAPIRGPCARTSAPYASRASSPRARRAPLPIVCGSMLGRWSRRW